MAISTGNIMVQHLGNLRQSRTKQCTAETALPKWGIGQVVGVRAFIEFPNIFDLGFCEIA